MLGKYALAFIVVFDSLDTITSMLEKAERDQATGDGALTLALLGQEAPLESSVTERIRDILRTVIERISSRMTFPSVTAQAKRVLDALHAGHGPKEISRLVDDLKTRLRDELEAAEFYYVSPSRSRYYRDAATLMGQDVNSCFPNAVDDIEDASKCLALGQGTAAVLHAMRIMECGLKAVGAALGVAHSPSWDACLRKISAELDKPHKTKSRKWKRDEAFYRDLSGDLLTVKQAWRNPTMHVERRYSADEAEQILSAATRFMQRLAAHFNEKQMQKLLK
ncbi:hypothetical protein [Bradyrhizobium sp. CCBAU 53380]|uniref:hypothetical protein n=1 Tax=Bradyrhizobium sp. CCBAU 53380 TaxID=1325117 RepID=UPI0023048C5F|nr:hypothetical protein [Bradyrhizobium sp. CCBAU 53380]MDA9420617.1 hypothetical protein [Bradyrhizobium sp. CCBAU 53380]